MLPFQGYCVFESYSNQQNNDNNNNNNNNGFFDQDQSLVNVMDGGESALSSVSKSEDKKSTEPCKSHKEAERRRRQRINGHLSTLRSLLPNTTKTDKASLLAEVVHHVKLLSKQAADAAAPEQEQSCPFPGESDEASVMSYFDREAKTTKISICCEDRPGLNRELSQAIRSVLARAVQAEMMTVAGRARCVVVVRWPSGGGGGEDVVALESALRAVVEKRDSGDGPGQLARRKKRARVCSLIGDDTNIFFDETAASNLVIPFN